MLLRAELDAIVVVSACPQDLTPINHGHPTSVGVALLTDQRQRATE